MILKNRPITRHYPTLQKITLMPSSALGLFLQLSRSRLLNIRRAFRAQPISKAFTAVTIARIATLHGLPVGPFSLSTTPVPLHKPRARHERQSRVGPQRRRASVCGSAAALRSGCDLLCAPLRPPLHFPRSPTADRSVSSSPRRPRQPTRFRSVFQ